ncbi:hypothetical protein C5S31_06865 [ANME-1 cluster archaeon GoMg2]|nr:hypothetical protein [ANME-1 cluster archaeon GoMg2]
MLENKIQKLAVVFVLVLLLTPAMASAQSTSEIAYQHKEVLDTYSRVIDTVSYNGTTYYVINYYNIFPYASGIEIISAEGSQVSDPNIAKSVLSQIAWKRAVSELSYQDITELSATLNMIQGIHSAISDVASATSSVTDKISELKGLFFGGECALDVIRRSYPRITTLKLDLEGFNDDLNEWDAASTSVTNNLSNVIQGVDDLKKGKEMDPELQRNIQKTLSAFETLKAESDDAEARLSYISSTLTDAEYALNLVAESTSKETTTGSLMTKGISAFADNVGDLNDQVESLRGNVSPISGSISEQSSRLSNLESAANKEAGELYEPWSSRRKAPVMVYTSLGGVVAVVLAIIFGALIYVMGRESLKAPVKSEGLTNEEEEARVKPQNAGWSSRRITGVIITAVGLILLLYSFITAYNFCIGEFPIDESYVIRIVFLSCMIGIGTYLTEKGAALPEHSIIIGVVLAPTGLFMLCFSFMVANTFVRGEFVFEELFIAKIVFLLYMIAIGGYLTGKGVTLTDSPAVTGVILVPLGAIMLLVSFITASTFVSREFMAYEIIMIVLIYFICMIGIGAYLTGRGVKEILKR